MQEGKRVTLACRPSFPFSSWCSVCAAAVEEERRREERRRWQQKRGEPEVDSHAGYPSGVDRPSLATALNPYGGRKTPYQSTKTSQLRPAPGETSPPLEFKHDKAAFIPFAHGPIKCACRALVLQNILTVVRSLVSRRRAT